MPSRTANLQSLLEAVPGALVGVDRAGVIRYANRQAESLFEYNRDELVGQEVETLVPESVRQDHPAHREKYFAGHGIRRPAPKNGGQPQQPASPRCLRGRRRDGTEFPLNLSLSQIDTEAGVMVIAAVRDLTARERVNDQRDRMSRLAAIVEHSNDAIIGKTLDGVITSWNPAAARMYGYSSEEIVGRSVELLSPGDGAQETTEILARIRAGRHIEHFETIGVRKDGTELAVSLSVSPICDADGSIVGASMIVRDLTKQVEAFDAARSMIEASLDSLVAISPEGKITDANQATVKVTGVPRDRLIGTAFSDYFTEPEKANQIYQRVFAEGMASDYPLTIRHRDGMLTEVLYNASVYRGAGGQVLGVFAAARDVTKQVQAQKELAEQQARGLNRLAELERFQRLTVGRELKMIELKKEIESLRRLSRPEEGEPGDQLQ
jgi:PAS domain S-box-containing protein